MTTEKNELLFMRLLLVYGGDPEPDTGKGSDLYTIWRNKIHAVLDGSEAGVAEYVNWLTAQGLHFNVGGHDDRIWDAEDENQANS